MHDSSTRLRVLHVVGGLERAGVETWLRRVTPRLRAVGVDSDFLVHEDRVYPYTVAVQEDGATVLVCPRPDQRLRYAIRFYRLLRAQQSYDVVHSHVQGFNTVVLAVARAAGVRKRVFHSHTTQDRYRQGAMAAAKRRLVAWLADAVSTDLVAVSDGAADSAFGSRGSSAARVMPGVDFAPFLRASQERTDRSAQPVVLHVGRFEAEKNHAFILDLAAAAKACGFPWRFVLVGAGSLRDRISARREAEGLENVILEDPRDDLLDLLAEADVFILPSHYEGLGLVAVEAQAAGVPIVVSGGVPSEALLKDSAAQQLEGFVTSEWIAAIETSLASAPPNQGALRAAAESSDLSLPRSVDALLSVYHWNPEDR